MRTTLLGLLAVFFSNGLLAAGGIEKYVPPFLVISSEKDASLADDEAVFEFQVMNEAIRGTGAYIAADAECDLGNGQFFRLDAGGRFEVKVRPGTCSFRLFAASHEEIYAPETEILPGHRTKVELRFVFAGYEIISDKPVIYLYPPKDLDVSVSVDPNGPFSFTYPAYGNGWSGTAHPDGSFTVGGRNYPYLFWESGNVLAPAAADWSEGYVVEKENTIAFLEEQLAAAGLSDREQTDFITYWGPRMTANDRNYVHFLFNEAVNVFARLSIEPQPEQLFRLYMIWSPVPEGVTPDVTPQKLQSVDRSGFYAIEWGGSEVPALTNDLHF